MITAIANQKGGVAKTTSAIALGGLLAEEGSCLVIDLDPQGNLTTGLGIDIVEGQPTSYEVLTGQVDIKDAIVSTPFDIHVLPANISLAPVEKELLEQEERFHVLRERLKAMRQRFEYILIDCPPSMGLLTANALSATHTLLIPVQCQFFAIKGLEGLLQTIDAVKKRINPNLKVLGVLPTMAEPNTLITQDVLRMLKEQFEGIKVFTPVPKSVKFPESNMAGKPIHIYGGEWKLIKPYREVVREIMNSKEEFS
jgi:chromosome partitioning protein